MYRQSGKPYVRRLSNHFVSEWKKFVGAAPTLARVNEILAESLKVNGQRRIHVLEPHGGMRPDKQLAQYWYCCGGLNLLIRIDLDNHTAVTLLTPHKCQG